MMETDFHPRNRKVLRLFILSQYLTIAFAIRALRLPASITAIEGGRAEFNCTTAGKAPDEDLYWAIKWNDGSLLWYYLPAEVNRTHRDFLRGTGLTPIRDASLGSHGRYSTVHRQEAQADGSALDLCLLRVDGIYDEDQGRYHCVYRRNGFFQNLYVPGQSNQAQLTVVVPPEGDAPSCGATQVASADPTLGGALVELSCISSVISVDPLPTITWITGNTELSSTTGNVNLYRYTLKEKDNGREFICLVTHPSLVNPSTCSILPLNEPPNAVISPENLVAAVGSDAVFKCIGSGIPYIVKYTWFVGDSSFSHFNTNGVITPELSFAGSEGWTLSLPNLKPSANNTKVTCEVSLPSGLSSNASATLTVRDSLPLSVTISPKRIRAFADSEISFSCFAATDAKHLHYNWYVGESLVTANTTLENQPYKITNLGRSGSILFVSKEQASAFENDVNVTCEAEVSTGSAASDSGLLIPQKNSEIAVKISPKVVEVAVGEEATFGCESEPNSLPNSTFLWLVRCDPRYQTRPTDTDDFWSESGSRTITLNKLKRDTQCDVTCSVSLPAGLSASATGLAVVRNKDQTVAIGEVQQPETRPTNWRLPGALGAGGVGIFLGIFFCAMLLLLYGCSKSYSRYNKTGGTSRSQVSTPIYETINPQNGSRDPVAPDLPTTRGRPCQLQTNATYDRPPMALPSMRVAMPEQRTGLQRIPSADRDSVASSISKDSLNTELGMNSSPSTATFGGASDSDTHEYESCEITTYV